MTENTQRDMSLAMDSNGNYISAIYNPKSKSRKANNGNSSYMDTSVDITQGSRMKRKAR